ncbi:MAG: Hsp20/alpha crystallin family protein [Candidatus Aenigmatarchaeota archaeon]
MKEKKKPLFYWEVPSFENMFKDTEKVQSDVFRNVFSTPRMNVHDTGKELILRVEVPGFKKSEINLEVTERTIEISGHKKHETKEAGKGFFKQELSHNSFHRTFTLPTEIEPSKTSARLEDGLLEVVMQKKREAREKKKKVAVE